MQDVDAVFFLECVDEFPDLVGLSEDDGVVEYCPAVAVVVVDVVVGDEAYILVAVDDVEQLGGSLHVPQLCGEDYGGGGN